MVLNSARLMPALSSRYCGMCWYFSNSAAQAAADSGGRMPITGCHSVIDKPDKVSLVTPPITTMTKIMAQHTSSQTATARRPVAAVIAAGACGVVAVETDTIDPCRTVPAGKVMPLSGDGKIEIGPRGESLYPVREWGSIGVSAARADA